MLSLKKQLSITFNICQEVLKSVHLLHKRGLDDSQTHTNVYPFFSYLVRALKVEPPSNLIHSNVNQTLPVFYHTMKFHNLHHIDGHSCDDGFCVMTVLGLHNGADEIQ